MKKIISILLSVLLLCAITGCTSYEIEKQITNQTENGVENFSPGNVQNNENTQVAEKQNVPDYDKEFSDRDLDSTYSSAETIDISENKEISITKEGTYVVTGSGVSRIIVDAGDNDKIQIVLKDTNITSDKNPILIKNADKVFLTIEGSNTISDRNTYEEDNIDAVIFSKADLTINGNGSLDKTAAAHS